MQITEEKSIATSVKVLGPSLVLDLSWCILKCANHEGQAGSESWSRELDVLGVKLNSFWDDGMKGVAEAEVLAYMADAIEVTDFATFKDRCLQALRSKTLDLDLALISESKEDATTIRTRLGKLRDSAELRELYFTLLSGVWAVVSPWWETQGLQSIRSAMADVERKLANGTKWQEISTQRVIFEGILPGIVERFEGGKPVYLAPCAFFGEGLYFEFSDCILVGFGTVSGSAASGAKERVSGAIAPLRALADPTRLAIFEFLKAGTSTIKEVSASFSLSQPTVSVHVKRLREVGLVEATRQGAQQTISINWTEADKLSGALHEVLSP